MFLFSLNISLISYAAEFKQYSSDVLMTLCLFLLVLKVDPFESRRKLIFLACMFAISFWFSHSALFVLCGIGCVYLLKILSSKLEIKTNILKLILLYLPSLISFCLFWCLHLKTIAASSGMHEYWVSYFINNFENLNFVIGEILQTYFFPCNSGFVLLLIIPSFLWIIKSKQNILEWMFFISPIVILFFLSYFLLQILILIKLLLQHQ